MHQSCEQAGAAADEAISGRRLVGVAAAYFLWPLVAAIVAAAAVKAETVRILAGLSALAAALAAAVGGGVLLRRRRAT